MNVRGSMKYALGLAAVFTLASSAFAQSDTAQRRIRLSKSEGTVNVPARVDTVIVTRDVTNTVVKTDTVMVLRQVIPSPIKSKFGPGFYVALAGGGLFPQDNLKDAFGAGPQVEGTLGYQGIRIPLGARVVVGYGKVTTRNESVVGDADLGNISVNGDVTWRIPLLSSNWRPAVYVLAGGGFNRLTYDQDTPEAKSTENQYGLRAGAGFTLGLGAANLFVESRYEWINAEDEGPFKAYKFVPVVVGFQFF